MHWVSQEMDIHTGHRGKEFNRCAFTLSTRQPTTDNRTFKQLSADNHSVVTLPSVSVPLGVIQAVPEIPSRPIPARTIEERKGREGEEKGIPLPIIDHAGSLTGNCDPWQCFEVFAPSVFSLRVRRKWKWKKYYQDADYTVRAGGTN